MGEKAGLSRQFCFASGLGSGVECLVFGILCIWDAPCLGFSVFGMRCIQDVLCSGCSVFGMLTIWDTWHFGCSTFRMLDVWDA